jgi:hypothetical protein
LDTNDGATAFKAASSTRPDALLAEMAPPLGIAPSSHRLTGGLHTLCIERNCSRPRGRKGLGRLVGGRGSRTCVLPFRRRMPWFARPRELKLVARLGAAPSISSSQARRIAVFLAREHAMSCLNGGLCGLCSRDLPLDRRLLFVAELTGRKWWVVSVTLRRWSGWTSALQAARDLYAATNPEIAGRGVAPR